MNYLLFTTTSCPKCPELKEYVKNNVNIEGKILDNTEADFMDLAKEHMVATAPTFIVIDENNKEVFRGSEVYEIEEFIKSKQI